jgi:AcrR family transcriptional regulator
LRSLKSQKQKRQYRLKRRAEKRDETHLVLARAAFELHATVGPSRATVSAIAEKAGVQRLTVYRHFPDDEAIFAACTAYSFAEDPPPDPESWRSVADPELRLREALRSLYGYYRRKHRLLANLYRDREMPAVAAALARRHAVLARGIEILSEGWPRATSTGIRYRRAAIGLVLDLATWQSLSEILRDEEAIEMALVLVRASAAVPAPASNVASRRASDQDAGTRPVRGPVV